jgi:hypothetical protein
MVEERNAGRGKGGKKKGGDPMLATLIGAAVGGLGANALEQRFERRERERRD